jgi:uncharacterized DUF497 family protein
MKITFDPAKRASTLRDRNLDFADAVEVFAGKVLNITDERRTMASQDNQCGIIARENGDRGLDAARQRTARIFDEESQ